MSTLPCEDCITFPMCRNRYLTNYRETQSPLRNLYILIDICAPLDDYIFQTYSDSNAERIFNTIDFLKGNTNEYPPM